MLQPPLLWPSVATPVNEVEAIKNLYAHLSGLEYSVLAWEAALMLYKTAKYPPPSISRSIANRWRFIACNECVLELYHLRARLKNIQSVALRGCPSLRNMLNPSKLRGVRKMLDEYFPDIEALRHATAHKGENEAYPEVHAPDGKYALSGFREPDRFSVPYEGKFHHLDMTDQSLKMVIEVVTVSFAVFDFAATELEKQGHLE